MSTGSKGRHQHQCELPAQREHSVGAVRGSQRFVVREEFSATLHTLCPAGSEAATPASSLPLTLFAFLYIGLYLYNVPCHAICSAERFPAPALVHALCCILCCRNMEGHLASTDGVISTPQELWTKRGLTSIHLGFRAQKPLYTCECRYGMHLKMPFTAHMHVGNFSSSTAYTS